MSATPEEGLYPVYLITTIKISWKEQTEINCTLNKDPGHIMFDLIHHMYSCGSSEFYIDLPMWVMLEKYFQHMICLKLISSVKNPSS